MSLFDAYYRERGVRVPARGRTLSWVKGRWSPRASHRRDWGFRTKRPSLGLRSKSGGQRQMRKRDCGRCVRVRIGLGGLTVFEAILKDVKKIDNRTHGGTEAAAGIGLDERILL